MESNYSALILKYTNKLKKEPSSSVFAPLAEIYLKMGQFEDALTILKKGLQQNPKSVYGYICLADCYIQRGEHDLAFATLKPLVVAHSENLKLQRIYADAAYHLGHYADALTAYKRILFFNPRNSEVAGQVKKLEDYLSEPVILDDSSEPAKEYEPFTSQEYFLTHNLDHTKIDDAYEGWVHMDLSQKKEAPAQEKFVAEIHSSPDLEELAEEEEEDNYTTKQTGPAYFQTTSMLDIFIGQKLWSNAKDIVDQLLDTASEEQRDSLLAKKDMIERELTNQLRSSASSGDDLMALYDSQVSQSSLVADSEDDIEEVQSSLDHQGKAVVKKAKLLKFLELVKDRSQES